LTDNTEKKGQNSLIKNVEGNAALYKSKTYCTIQVPGHFDNPGRYKAKSLCHCYYTPCVVWPL